MRPAINTVVVNSIGRPYSDLFLTMMSDDLEMLAEDMRKAGCSAERVNKIKNAARVVRVVQAENAAGDD